MRVFVAVEVSNHDIINGIRNLQKSMGQAGKAVEPDNLHFTLRFLGEVDADQAGRVADALSAIRFEEFDVELRGVGTFGGPRRPRVLWVGTDTTGGRSMGELAGMVDGALDKLGWRRDKPFRAHLTVMRVKNREGLGGLPAYRDRIWGTQRIRSVKLKRSVLDRTGPAYTDLAEVEAVRM